MANVQVDLEMDRKTSKITKNIKGSSKDNLFQCSVNMECLATKTNTGWTKDGRKILMVIQMPNAATKVATEISDVQTNTVDEDGGKSTPSMTCTTPLDASWSAATTYLKSLPSGVRQSLPPHTPFLEFW